MTRMRSITGSSALPNGTPWRIQRTRSSRSCESSASRRPPHEHDRRLTGRHQFLPDIRKAAMAAKHAVLMDRHCLCLHSFKQAHLGPFRPFSGCVPCLQAMM
jgi:hypothetical protein